MSSNNSIINSSRLSLLAYPVILAIHLYRLTLSPLLIMMGGGCRFYPSCSQYALDAIGKYGALRGSIMAAKRLSKCHPWHEGGIDLVE